MERILNMIAHIVETAGPNITTGTFELVSALFHLVVVSLSDALRNLVQARHERHHL